MEHFEDGGYVEFSEDYFKIVLGEANKEDDGGLSWDWDTYDYRIKEQKQKVTIEKWLIKDVNSGEYFIKEGEPKHLLYANKLKLIESYEVEL